MWVIEDFEETLEETLVKQDTQRFCSVMASTHDFDFRNLCSTTSKSSIDVMWKSYSQEDQTRWIINSGCTSHITKRRDLFVEEIYKPLPRNKKQIRTATGQLVPAVGIGNVRISIWIPGRGRG